MDTTYILVVIGIILLGAWAAIFFGRKSHRDKQGSSFTQALTLLLSGDKLKALEKLRQVTKEDTDNIQAYLLYGDILRELGQYQRAAKIHKELTVRNKVKQEEMQDILRSLILDFEGGGFYQQALSYSEKLLSYDRNEVWALKKKLTLQENLGDWKIAGDTAKKLQNVSGQSDKEILALYRIMEGKELLAKGGKEHDARLLFRAGIKIDHSCAAGYIELADSYLRENRGSDAFNEWKALFSNNPKMAHLSFVKLENTAFDLGRFEELESIYNKLLKRDPANSRAIVALARFLERKGEISRAIDILEEGLSAAPESLWIRRNLFRLLALENRQNEALELGLEVIKMVTSDKEAFLCGKCGHVADEPMWRCPNCRSWRSYKF